MTRSVEQAMAYGPVFLRYAIVFDMTKVPRLTRSPVDVQPSTAVPSVRLIPQNGHYILLGPPRGRGPAAREVHDSTPTDQRKRTESCHEPAVAVRH